MNKGWIGVDLDGTLAYHDNWEGYNKIGKPIPRILHLVKKLLMNGFIVKIFTARAEHPEYNHYIEKWLSDNGLPKLEITNIKDMKMILLFDDKCKQVELNTGKIYTKI